ncbi:MAG: ral secretion pathway protein [Ramlibacter sp.]|nr:ral secretion pathway protein [Ramlibacter sp.]
MPSHRFLISVLALAAAQAGAQVLAPTPAAPTAPAAAPQPAANPGAGRIIRGNDTVVAPQSVFAAPEGASTNFRFEDAPIREVAQAILGDLLKLDYVIHPPVDGRITLVTQAGITPDGAIYLLESALQASGAVLARDARGTYHIGKPDVIKAIVPAARVAGNGPIAPGQGVIVIPLRYIGASEMATILRPMVSQDAIIRVDTIRNLLVMSGSRTQAEGWLSLVSTFDVDLLKGMSVGVFPLKYATVREVEAGLQLLTPTGARPPAAPGGAAAAPGAAAAAFAEGNPLAGAFRVLPIERLNSILVVTPRAAYLEEARRWIEQLDRPGNSALEPRLNVYAVRNGSAAHLAAVLNGIFGDGKSQAPAASGVAPGLASTQGATVGGAQGGGGVGAAVTSGMQTSGRSAIGQGGAAAVSRVELGGNLRVVADELNNAILVYGTPAEFERVEQALRRLDVPVTQVLIEASIVEVTLTDDTKFGLQWIFSDALSNGKTGTSVLSTQGGGVLGGPMAGFSYTLSNALGVRAVLNALAEKSLVKVISSPSLMVLDNHTASISVGNQQPIRSSETITSGGNISTSIQYKDTGVALSVLPTVNAGDMVTMQISQAVTDVGPVDDQATGQRSFLQRQISSKVAVRSGETIVLGGLIRDNGSDGSSGIPVVHEIPIFGALFGQKIKTQNRTELLVIITPRVVRSDQDARDISRDLRLRMKDFGAGLSTLGRGPRAGLPIEPEFVPPPAPPAPVPYEPSGPNTP